VRASADLAVSVLNPGATIRLLLGLIRPTAGSAKIFGCAGAPIPPAFFGSSQDFVDLELEYEASDDYLEDTSAHNILRVFDVAVVMRTALRGWRSFDIRTACSLASLASTEDFIVLERPVPAR
jgi:hypothetical protein